MALKVLLMRSKLDAKKKALEALRQKDADFERREAELETAISEMTEETSEEDRQAIEGQAEALEQEKESHNADKTALETEITNLENEIAEEEKKNSKLPATKAEGAENERRRQGEMETRTKFFGMSRQERDAFFAKEDVKTFLNQVRTCIREKRALNNAGLTIPDVMLELLKEKVTETSKLVRRVTRRPVAGTARQVIMGEIPEAIWTEMCATLNEMDLGFNDTEVDGYKVGGFFAVCNAVLEDNDVNLASEIINALGKAIGKALDKAIIYGTGVKMPLGIVTRLAQKTKPSDYLDTAREWKDLSTSHIITGTGATGLKLFQEIVKNSGVVENDYFESGLTWVMSKKTHMELMVQSMEKNLNAAIVAGINNNMPVVGGEIVELPFVPDGNYIVGYFDAYLLAERAGTTIGQSEHVRFIEDQTVFKGTARYDGKPVIAEAFAVGSLTTDAPGTSVTFPQDKANATED